MAHPHLSSSLASDSEASRNALVPSMPPSFCLVLGTGVSQQSGVPGCAFPGPRPGHLGYVMCLQAHTAGGSVRSQLGPAAEAAPHSPSSPAHAPALLACPLGSRASSHTGWKSALCLLPGTFSHLSLLTGESRADGALCSAPIRPHPGTASFVGCWAGDTRGSCRGPARKACATRAGSAWLRRGLGAPNSTLWCLWGRHQGKGAWLLTAVPGERGRGSGIRWNWPGSGWIEGKQKHKDQQKV